MTASAHPDATVMNHTHDQTTTQGDKRKLLSSFSLNGDGSSRMDMSSTGSIWSKAASTPQECETLDFGPESALDTPFLHHVATVSRPGSFTFNAAHHDTHALNPVRTSNTFSAFGSASQHAFPPFLSCPAAGAGTAGGLTAGSDMWSEPQQPNTASSDSSSRKSLDVPHNSPAAEGAFAAAASANKHVSWVDTHVSTDPKGPFHAVSSFPAGQLAGQTPSLWGHSTLLSVSSAPAPLAGCAGDLRDQGRASWGGVSGGVMGGAAGFNPLLGHALEAHEEVSTPLQAMTADCINNLLGSFGSSLFCDSLPATPASRRAARTAFKQAPILPDFVEAWEGPCKDTAAQLHTTPRYLDRSSTTASNTVNVVSAGANRAASSLGGSANGGRSSSSGGSSAFAGLNGAASAAAAAAAAGMMTHNQSFSVQSYLNRMSQAFPAPHAYPCMLNHAYSTPALRHPANGLQHTSSIDSLAAGFPATATLGPTHSGPFDPVAMSTAAATAGQSYGYGPMAHMMMHPLQGTASMPAAQAAGYGNTAALAADMRAYSMVGDLSGHSAAAQAQFYEAWAMAGLNGGSNLHHHHAMGGMCGNSSSGGSSSSANRCAGPWRQTFDSGNNVRGHRKMGSLNSKVDPKSMCGVDPRLCVGSPSDVEYEVCRRNPGLAELLRLSPRSVKLVNVPVMQDTSPPELLASKRMDGPITPDELTLESGLLRHCFGLPSSIGPDLVRAARHAVSRGDEPGSGLEPFFWALQGKLNWLLKRPVFFKGQLLRGEIHAITDKQRAESFAQVTEQRSKLGELLLVLFSMLQPTDGNKSA